MAIICNHAGWDSWSYLFCRTQIEQIQWIQYPPRIKHRLALKSPINGHWNENIIYECGDVSASHVWLPEGYKSTRNPRWFVFFRRERTRWVVVHIPTKICLPAVAWNYIQANRYAYPHIQRTEDACRKSHIQTQCIRYRYCTYQQFPPRPSMLWLPHTGNVIAFALSSNYSLIMFPQYLLGLLLCNTWNILKPTWKHRFGKWIDYWQMTIFGKRSLVY